MFRYKYTLFYFLSIIIITSCEPSFNTKHLTQLSGATMGTQYSIKIADALNNLQTTQLQTEIDAILEHINSSMSTYRKDSELSRINQAQHDDWIVISDELLTVIDKAQTFSRLSNGAFDITVGPLVNLWGFGPDFKDDQIPDNASIDSLKEKIGYQKLELDIANKRIRKTDPSLYLDLSAIAKGYGVDCLADYLESQNITNYLVEIGGELKARGHNAHNQAWQIAIEKPSTEERNQYKTILLTQSAVATSGDYRNFFESKGKRYSHTINPHTGRPITHPAAAVTVIHSSAMEADGLATMLLVLGPEEGYALAQKLKLPVLFILRDGDGFQDKSTDLFGDYQIKPGESTLKRPFW